MAFTIIDERNTSCAPHFQWKFFHPRKKGRAKSARPQNNQITGTTAIAGLSTVTRLAIGGDVVLLSPACASYDMFENFEQRGREFCKLIRQISD
jgi:UDP-N-acetylmuramoylalanine-D-glutamate ligase